jgi:hypothetical protein
MNAFEPPVKWIGWEQARGRPFATWLSQAAISYTLCGLAAGVLSASVWFYFNRQTSLLSHQV